MRKIYGPYLRKDGRKHVIIYENGKRRTVSYPKFLMEQHLGRQLDPNKETIDHKDRDITNDDISNFRIVERRKHASEDALRVKNVTFICPICGVRFTPKIKDVINNRKKGKVGPFCSKSCAGTYGALLQQRKICPFKIEQTVERIYYRKNK